MSCVIDGHRVIEDLDLRLEAGQLACLLGPSGCGKTTVLRAVAGLQPIGSGRILVDGVEVAGPGHNLAPEARRIGLVFQDLALFPHLTLAGNVAFGLPRGLSRQQRVARTEELLQRVGLAGLGGRWPHQVSGGQQQRAALARSLAPEPRLLLLDEPFSSLDAHLRASLREELRALLKSLGVTAILVTHDQEEAFAFADWIGVMREGRIEQWARPFDVYHKPATPFVAGFVGGGRLLPAVVDAQRRLRCGLGTLAAQLPESVAPGQTLRLLLRPDDLTHDPTGQLQAEVLGWAFRGAETLYSLRLAGGEVVQALFPSHLRFRVGEAVPLALDLEHVIVFAPD